MSAAAANVEKIKGKGHVTLRLNRPAARNALAPDDMAYFNACLDELHKDPDVQVVVITGAGTAFCAGADIKHINALSGAKLASYIDAWTEALVRIISMPKMVVAAVNGACAGGGNHLMLCSDFCVASSAASFHFTAMLKGLPDLELGSLLLPMQVGLKRAKWLMMRGGPVSPQEAVAHGFCNAVFAEQDWAKELDAFVAELASHPPGPIAHTKYALNQAAYQMLGPVKLSALAGSLYMSGLTDLPAGKLKKK
ncbi:MAG: 3-hydroxypropionyl-coenzyme dehydratase [Betaproteobacteria bacterium]|nr:3-hydroxypropionyl-coenzyme dehydratase [Betaproteobacteria bacterium]